MVVVKVILWAVFGLLVLTRIFWGLGAKHEIDELRSENLWLKSHWRKHD